MTLYPRSATSPTSQPTVRGIKRRAVDSTQQPESGLATLATVSAERISRYDSNDSTEQTQRSRGSSTLEEYSLTSSTATADKKQKQSHQLEFDSITMLPQRDIMDELISHNDNHCNLVSKLLQPQRVIEDYRRGKHSAFFLLTLMANSVPFSKHPAIKNIGHNVALRMIVDRAKVLVPEALEQPSVVNCQSILMLSLAYVDLGMLDVSSHYSSISLRTLQQLGVHKIDDNGWGDDGWLQGTWVEREQIRRLIWGSFTVDTFLSVIQHTTPYVVVDLSGVNRPCAQNMWYVGNDNLDSLNYPKHNFNVDPEDSQYLATLKAIKHDGMPWLVNGNTVQINFAMLANAVLRAISDPLAPQDQVDSLVVNACKSIDDWIAPLPTLPKSAANEEICMTLMISAAAIGVRSIITPHLLARSYQTNLSNQSSSQDVHGTQPIMRALATDTGRWRILHAYMRGAYQYYQIIQHGSALGTYNEVPPMFASYAMSICGGMFAACARSAPTLEYRTKCAEIVNFLKQFAATFVKRSLVFRLTLKEIEDIEHMVKFLPRRLDPSMLARIRDALLPIGSIESAVNKPFAVFLAPIMHLLKPRGANQSTATTSVCDGTIPLTSNLCAIFGQSMASICRRFSRSTECSGPLFSNCDSTSSSSDNATIPFEKDENIADTQHTLPSRLPDCKLSYTAISSLMICLNVAAMDESLFTFMNADENENTAEKNLSPPLSQSPLSHIIHTPQHSPKSDFSSREKQQGANLVDLLN
ncbi:hypothetical protein COEREDRAFT_99966 [Coemansia reversa NRRL 1564]|uniref:Xylanolytic transcriptional activator regulatory domain-containing protein n=1 Tax=Coemansia reversa (strain ATCC 12441 / NRRL 1564) TaxID=763665 RepID=A0A2G5B165_COERN|nr:hypothetical protein COEREDRAFT_99966 [Coemansia reversa NRRL 1564]|eukprot:PIA12752.1 hypothetical protein COEREDRAFT_99966 [Coemansia reversa NRRL 1564]